MLRPSRKLPFFIKGSLILIGICAFIALLYVGQEIIIPLVLAAFFAILLNPVVAFFHRWLSRVMAISVTMALACLAFIGLVYFIGSQLSMFSESIPVFEIRMDELTTQMVRWISRTFDVEENKILNWLEQLRSTTVGDGTAYIGTTLTTLTGIVTLLTLIPIYTVMMLYYEPLLLEFIHRVFSRNEKMKVDDVIIETKSIMQSYLAGLVFEALIVTALTAIGLLLMGIDYAILWAVIAALLNIIPYIGTIIAVIFPVIIAMLTKDGFSYPFLVVGLYIVIQFIDNNIIVPKIVASRVKINALVSVIVVILGGALWGITGMFLSIPVTAITKIIFDRITELKPYGYLLGDTMPNSSIKLVRLFRNKRPRLTRSYRDHLR